MDPETYEYRLSSLFQFVAKIKWRTKKVFTEFRSNFLPIFGAAYQLNMREPILPV